MSSFEKSVSPSAQRGQGKRAGLDLEKILAAARALAPEALTLQAVAETLGVSRKAINYYVADRDSLLALLVEENFVASFEKVRIAKNLTWQDACSTYCRRYADSLIKTGTVADYLRLTRPLRRFLAPADAVIGKLIAAGFSDEIAMRSVALLANVAMSFALDTLVAARDKENPLSAQLQSALEDEGKEKLTNIERAVYSSIRTYDREQLEIGIELIVNGLDSLLRKR